ncbi:hypothetical protein ABT150_49905 [Streptomyces mirabilis]|uniref:hypothetical protein n=1 Tax=Streptomyces mirabilis TaxID=68239 RepID=UPI003318781E
MSCPRHGGDPRFVARLSALSSTTLAGFVLGCWEWAHDARVQTAAQGSRNRHGGGDVDGAGHGPGRVRGAGVRAHRGHRPAGTVCLPAAQATLVVLLNTGTGHNGAEPSTLFGEAITKIVSPGHIFNLPAQPAAR